MKNKTVELLRAYNRKNLKQLADAAKAAASSDENSAEEIVATEKLHIFIDAVQTTEKLIETAENEK